MNTQDSADNLAQQRATWGAALADTLLRFPALAHELRSRGIDADPSTLTSALHLTSTNDSAHQLHDALVAMFTTLNSSVHELFMDAQSTRESITQLNSQVDHLRDLNDRLLSTMAQNARPAFRRLSKDPDRFDGAQKNISERQETYTSWKTQILLNFAQDEGCFTSERSKILHICGLLAGEAKTNNTDMSDSITKEPHDVATWLYKTSSDFLKALDKQYCTLDLAHSAGIQFDKLEQKSRPFQNFLAEFNTLAKKCRKTEDQKVESLKKKVSEEIAIKIAADPSPPARDDFNAWAEKCQTWYNNQVEYEHNQKLRGGNMPRLQDSRHTSPQSYRNSQQQQAVQQPVEDPMQLDAIRPHPQSSPHQRPDRATCAAHGLCFYCKEPGHIADQCDKKKIADARRAAYVPSTGRPQYRQTRTRSPGNLNPYSYYNGGGRGRVGLGDGLGNSYRRGWQNPYDRLHLIGQGFVEDEVSSNGSPAPSESASQIPPNNYQGNA